MSTKATTWAKAFRAGNATGKSILLVLADYADDRGCCWPSMATICDEAEVKTRTARGWIAKWEKAGVLKRIQRHRENGGQTTSVLVLVGHRAELIRQAIKRGTSLPDPVAGYDDPPAGDAAPLDVREDDTPRQEMPGEGAADAGAPGAQPPPLKKNPTLGSPPLPPEAGGYGSDRLEGFDLFMSVWPGDWPGVMDSEKLLRSRWRAAVDRHGADPVLASARNYLAKAQAAGGQKASVGYFLARKSGLVRKFLPADAPAAVIEPVVLGDSDEHRFLAECREAGASEAQIRRWAKKGAFRIKRDGPLVAAVAADGSDQFQAAFADVLRAHGMSAYSETFWQRRLARKARAG